MNYIILATERSLPECLSQFRGDVNIFHIGEDESFLKYIKELSTEYMETKEDGTVRPRPKLMQLNDLKPSLRSVFAKGNQFIEHTDSITGEIVNKPFDEEEYLKMNAYFIVQNPVKMASLYLLANQVFNGNRPVIFTCREAEDEDLLLTQIIHYLFLNWFKIYPVSIYELINDPIIMDSIPEPKYKAEVDDFVERYKKGPNSGVNLR